MSAHDAAERFARGSGKKTPAPPLRHERPAEQPPPRRIAPEEEEIEPMYTSVERPNGQGCAGFVMQGLFLSSLLGILVLMAWWAVSTGRLDTPAPAEQRPTAAIEARPTSRPYPTGAAPAAAPVPTTDHEAAIRAYNEQQAARAAAFAQEATQEALGQAEAPPADNHEAEIEAWLEAPASTLTPLPAPGEAGFVESFEDAPQCSPFIGYLPGDPCVEILKQQAGE